MSWKRAGGAAIALAGVVVLYLLLYPGAVRQKSDPGYLDNLFANAFVVFALRSMVVVVAGAASVYAVWSVFEHIRSGRPFHRLGPVEAAQADEKLQEADARIDQVEAALHQVAMLEAQLEETNRELERIAIERDTLRDALRAVGGETP